MAFEQGRKVLVLTERTEHLEAILSSLAAQRPPPFVLHGRMSKKQRTALIAELDALAPQAPRILLATGKLVGEGFDHPPMKTVIDVTHGSLVDKSQIVGRGDRQYFNEAKGRYEGLTFIDTTNPTAPVLLGSQTVRGNPVDVKFAAGLIWVATETRLVVLQP